MAEKRKVKAPEEKMSTKDLLEWVDISLRGALIWAGAQWGEHGSVMHAVRGAVETLQEIHALRADNARKDAEIQSLREQLRSVSEQGMKEFKKPSESLNDLRKENETLRGRNKVQSQMILRDRERYGKCSRVLTEAKQQVAELRRENDRLRREAFDWAQHAAQVERQNQRLTEKLTGVSGPAQAAHTDLDKRLHNRFTLARFFKDESGGWKVGAVFPLPVGEEVKVLRSNGAVRKVYVRNVQRRGFNFWVGEIDDDPFGVGPPDYIFDLDERVWLDHD